LFTSSDLTLFRFETTNGRFQRPFFCGAPGSGLEKRSASRQSFVSARSAANREVAGASCSREYAGKLAPHIHYFAAHSRRLFMFVGMRRFAAFPTTLAGQ
jgi:hypothetical protein